MALYPLYQVQSVGVIRVPSTTYGWPSLPLAWAALLLILHITGAALAQTLITLHMMLLRSPVRAYTYIRIYIDYSRPRRRPGAGHTPSRPVTMTQLCISGPMSASLLSANARLEKTLRSIARAGYRTSLHSAHGGCQRATSFTVMVMHSVY
jgi:hypothetical protein